MPPPEEADDTDSEIDFTGVTAHGDDDGQTVGELVALEDDEELEDIDALGMSKVPHQVAVLS